MSWVATVIPRIRWTVTVLFGVVADADREALKPKKKRGRANRAGLIHVKRMMLALLFTRAFWTEQKQVSRSFELTEPPLDLTLVVDASLWGIGGILVHVRTWSILGAFSYAVSEEAAGVRVGGGKPAAGQDGADWSWLPTATAGGGGAAVTCPFTGTVCKPRW